MKIHTPSSSSSLLYLSYLYTLTIAALSVVNPLPANASTKTTLNTTLGYPPSPFQLRIPATSTSLIFGKYGAPIPALTVTGIVERALFETVTAVVRARGDGPIAQPTFEWRHGRVYVRVEQYRLGALRWVVMAEAVHGVVEFGETFGFFGSEFTVVEDEAGVVGVGSVGVGYS